MKNGYESNKTKNNHGMMCKILQPKKREDSFEDDFAYAHNNHLCIDYFKLKILRTIYKKRRTKLYYINKR